MDWPRVSRAVPPVITPFSDESLGDGIAATLVTMGDTAAAMASSTWPASDLAIYIPFEIYEEATITQLLWWVGATSSGNLDVGVYDDQFNKIVSAGNTAMSATVNVIQELNVTDTVIQPGRYYLAGKLSNTTGTIFRFAAADELSLGNYALYEQALGGGAALPDVATPVISTKASPIIPCIGVQFASVI